MGLGPFPATGAEFMVAVQNTGESDYVLNLGLMLANGRVMFPKAIRLILSGPAGDTRELHYSDRRYGAIGGRLDSFVVPLRTGSTYVLSLSLDQYFSTATKEYSLKLIPGRHRITAQFEGRVAPATQLDMQGIALLNYWTGTVESGAAEFEVSSSSN